MSIQKTLFGQTAGGILKTAKVVKNTSAGFLHVVAVDRRGNVYQVEQSIYGNLILWNDPEPTITMSVSDTARRKLELLIGAYK